MYLQTLNDKYGFNIARISRMAKLSNLTVYRFFSGKHSTLKTASAIINVLPITPEERSSLIESMFAPDAKD